MQPAKPSFFKALFSLPFYFMQCLFLALYHGIRLLLRLLGAIFGFLFGRGFKEMNGYEYEQFAASYLRSHGYRDIEVTKSSGDFGVDILARRKRKKYAVQCKYYAKPVGNAAVQEAVAGKAYYDCNEAMVITNSHFTQGARRLAEANGVILLEGIAPKRFSFRSKSTPAEQTDHTPIPLSIPLQDPAAPNQEVSMEKRSKIVSLFTPKWLCAAREEFIVLDLETTGLDKSHDRIVEIAAIRFVGGVEEDRFVTLVNPEVPIPSEVICIHGITDEQVADAPTIEEILPALLDYLGESLLVGHNANFDIGFIEVAARRMGFDPAWSYIDTVSVAKKMMQGLPNYRQQTILDAIGYHQESYHRAEDDCRGCAQILLIAMDSLAD